MSLLQIMFGIGVFCIVAPFVLFFCGKWGAVGWFRGKHIAENKMPFPKEQNDAENET
ncbi:MAG: hypothetical protein RBT66_00660 [bacterium]|nr:hypothetical protein [bacterium]